MQGSWRNKAYTHIIRFHSHFVKSERFNFTPNSICITINKGDFIKILTDITYPPSKDFSMELGILRSLIQDE